MDKVKDVLGNKYVLYGGVAIGALLLYMYVSGGASSGSADTTSGDATGASYPYSVVYGMGAPDATTATASTATTDTGTTLGAGDQALVDLQSKQLDLSGQQMNLNYNLSVLQTNNQHDTDMANIAATAAAGLQASTSTDFATLTKAFAGAEAVAGQHGNLVPGGLTATVNGQTLGINVVQPGGGMSATPQQANSLLTALFGRAA